MNIYQPFYNIIAAKNSDVFNCECMHAFTSSLTKAVLAHDGSARIMQAVTAAKKQKIPSTEIRAFVKTYDPSMTPIDFKNLKSLFSKLNPQQQNWVRNYIHEQIKITQTFIQNSPTRDAQLLDFYKKLKRHLGQGESLWTKGFKAIRISKATSLLSFILRL